MLNAAKGALCLFVSIFTLVANAAVGEIEYVRGSGAAQTPGAAPRLLGKGLVVSEGDVVTTGPTSYAVVKLSDGTRMTVRPDSSMAIKTFRYDEKRDDNSMVVELLKGGLRALTGLIPKKSTTAARIETSTATIGIRGTDFDARICKADCAQENRALAQAGDRTPQIVSARVVQLQGDVTVVDVNGQRRKVAQGGPTYVGDTVQTEGGQSFAVLAFRDESKVTVQPNTHLKLEDFVFDDKQPQEGRFLLNLLRGGMRALTGLIGKANQRNVSVQTRTATIGIRGTGFDVSCTGSCAGDVPGANDFATHVWFGSVELQPRNPSLPPLILTTGQTGGGNGLNPLQVGPLPPPLQFNTPRPDNVPVDMPRTFGQQAHNQDEAGVYVTVRDGHVSLTNREGNNVELGRGEVGFAGEGNRAVRPERLPVFIEFDRIPRPDQLLGRNMRLQENVDRLLGPRRECR